jgi:hypothetical protein
MTDNDSSPAPAKRELRFSLGQLLLIVTIACLVLAIVLMSFQMRLLGSRLESTQQELSALQPLSVDEVARQFQAATTLGPVTTKVSDVRYSPKEDAYRVRFSWTDAKTAQTWSTDVELKNDGFGTYVGAIRNSEFIQPLGYTDQFFVAVETPSKFSEQRK